MKPATRHPLPATRHPLPVTRHPSPVTRHPPPATRHPPPAEKSCRRKAILTLFSTGEGTKISNCKSDFVFRSEDYGFLPAQDSGRGKEIEFSNNATSHSPGGYFKVSFLSFRNQQPKKPRDHGYFADFFFFNRLNL